jgi:hypothetical protein
MTYIPKNMVNTNLYTAGGEFTDEKGQPYEGYYHELFNGQTNSGKNPLTPNSKRLIKSTSSRIQSGSGNNVPISPLNTQYQSLNPINQELYEYGKDPDYFVVQPTGEDYRRGTITRYFAKRKNQTPPQIREINKATFDSISNQDGEYNYALWSIISLFWKISGPLFDSKDQNGVLKAGIVNTNQRLRDSANLEFRGIRSYLSDLIQYSIKPDITLVTNQYTAGNEFTIRQDNSDYIGYYHIMADGTIMDGADMAQSQNVILLAGNVLVQNRVNTLVKDALANLGTS